MSETTTQDFAAYEEEAGFLLSVYESLPDSMFKNAELLPHQFIVEKIKAFARAYHSLEGVSPKAGVVIN